MPSPCPSHTITSELSNYQIGCTLDPAAFCQHYLAVKSDSMAHPVPLNFLKRRLSESSSSSPRPKRPQVPPTEGSPCLIPPVAVAPYPFDGFVSFISQFFWEDIFVLHLGCGDGRITFALADRMGPTANILGVNAPGQDTKLAEELADERYGAITAEDRNITFVTVPDLTKLPFESSFFDVVYASDIMTGFPARDDHLYVGKALIEMHRVTKPGGCMASRDIAAHHFFPEKDLGNLLTKALFKATGLSGWYGPLMPGLFKALGFKLKGEECIEISSTVTLRGPAVGEINWASDYAWTLRRGSIYRERWVNAGVSDAIIDLIMKKLYAWGKQEHSMYACLYTEICAFKEPEQSPPPWLISPSLSPAEGLFGDLPSLASPGEASTSGTSPRETSLIETLLGEALPNEALLNEHLPSESLPSEGLPSEALPGEAPDGEVFPSDNLPGNISPSSAPPADTSAVETLETSHVETVSAKSSSFLESSTSQTLPIRTSIDGGLS
ncbi:S-adenosyl-L-methionine-dependent methyltransferase [Nemania abortiva]|nr:S-adenosyl-L-methionine-dependent methyltransferase [Nemania abortiva]